MTPSTHSPYLTGQRLHLREVRLDDVNDQYYQWMNDPEVTQFLETRYHPQSLDNIRRFVESMDGKTDEIFLAICLHKDDRHIGNIKLGPINWIHRFADISLLIGAKDCWGQGYAGEAIGLIVKFAFQTLNLHKLRAGCYADNIGSKKAFLKNGFVEEGVLKNQWFVTDRWVDELILGLENK